MEIKNPKILEAFKRCGSVSTDTRKVQNGDLFFALKGPNFNGNAFAAKALEAGAGGVVVDEEEYFLENDPRYFLVPNGLKALQDLALDYRREFSIPVIGTLRESQNYIRSAERGLGLFELAPSMVWHDLDQWDPIMAWLNSKRSLPAK